LIKDFYDNVYKQYIALKELEKKNVRKFDNKKFAVKTAQSVSEQQADSVSYQVEKRQRKAAGGCCPF
jgi:predicted subunit of tRNA(5-methylaminomethyl-2-thiouridylate) methyltransferase